MLLRDPHTGKLLTIAGKLLTVGVTQSIGTAPAPIAPGQVGALTAGSAGSVSIPVTYTAASGTAPITYTGRVATHGSGNFAPNNGSFGATGGSFVGLTAGTAYDLQIVATNSAGSSATTLTNVTTVSTPVVQPLAPTSNGNRLELLMDQSAATPGSTATGKLVTNGLWSGGTATVGGVSVTLPSSGNAPVALSFTASGSEMSFAITNNSGLYNGYSGALTVMAPSSGTARTLGVSMSGSLNPDASRTPRTDLAIFQRDVASGAPVGFGSQWTRGWGEVWFSVDTLGGTTGGLFIRLYDALSSGATGAAGTGTELTSGAVQVYGAISATGVVRLLLPASASTYYADLAADAAFTHPVRVQTRFSVGVNVGVFSRSYECGITRSFNDGTAFTPFYSKVRSFCSSDHRYPASQYNNAYWYIQDGLTTNSFTGETVSAAAQEFGRLMEAQLGVVVGLTGSTEAGGDFNQMFGYDGSASGGFTGTVSGSVGNKFRYMWVSETGWTGDSTYPNETHDEVRSLMLSAVDWIAKTYSACAVIGWCAGSSGWFGADGSRAVGYTRNQMIIQREIEPANPMVVSKENLLWNEYVGGHASQAARKDYARTSFRLLMSAESAAMGGYQTAQRGPVLAKTGTVSGRTLSIPYTLAPNASLQAVGATYADPAATYNTPTTTELASLFGVYLQGQQAQAGTAIKIDSATINSSAKTIDLVLTGASGVTFADGSTGAMPSAFTVCYGSDFTVSNNTVQPGSGRGVMLTDDRIDTGIPYGWAMRPALDIAAS